jgi:hypothetical protein
MTDKASSHQKDFGQQPLPQPEKADFRNVGLCRNVYVPERFAIQRIGDCANAVTLADGRADLYADI